MISDPREDASWLVCVCVCVCVCVVSFCESCQKMYESLNYNSFPCFQYQLAKYKAKFNFNVFKMQRSS